HRQGRRPRRRQEGGPDPGGPGPAAGRLPRQHLVCADARHRLRPGPARFPPGAGGAHDLRRGGRRSPARPGPGRPEQARVRLDDGPPVHARPAGPVPVQGLAQPARAPLTPVRQPRGDSTMKRLRFVMIGGFLGAGKTTAISRLARHYLDRGQRVGLVTTDQAQDLVDTTSLRAQGFPVEEVAGACFCCRFDDLVGKVGRLQEGERPDVILAEPVGSCTDLVATVVQPLRDLYRERFEVAPYPVLFKPSHGLRILRNEAGSGFSPKAAYIFRKQLEEADAIAINRIDEIAPAVLKELTDLIARDYPGVPTLRLSAKTGEGFEALTELLDQQGNFGRKILDIDYDTYAEGEAELGWLNSSIRVTASQP